MRLTAVIGVGLALSSSLAFGQAADRPRTEQVEARFMRACLQRLHFDEPLGNEDRHRRFCTCRFDRLRGSSTAEEFAEIAANLEQRNAASAAPERLPPGIDRANQTAITACMKELSR